MAEKTFNSRIIHKHDTEAKWLTADFTPKQGEIIVYDKDENYNYERLKIGDGVTSVSNLPFIDDATKKQIIDTTLEQAGKAADAKVVGGAIADIKALIGDENIAEQIKKESPVKSVNGQTGAIVLTAADVGALPDTTEIPSIEGLVTQSDVVNGEYIIFRTEGTSTAYTGTIDGITELKTGMTLIMIPHITSTSRHAITLNINELGAKSVYRRATDRTLGYGITDDWLAVGNPIVLLYCGSYWEAVSMPKPLASDLKGSVPIELGGHGGTTAAEARANLGITPANIGALPVTTAIPSIEGLATETYVDEKMYNLVGDEPVADQISSAITKIDYPVDIVNGKTGAITLTYSDVGALPDTIVVPTHILDGEATGSVRTSGSKAESDEYKLGSYAFAEGYNAIASGDYSHAEGNNTTAASAYQHVQGRYNLEDTEGKYAHIVGGGVYHEDLNGWILGNINTLDWNGIAWFANSVKVGGSDQDDVEAKTLATEDYVAESIAGLASKTEVNTIVAELASADDVDQKFKTMVGDEPVALQISREIDTKADVEHSHDDIYYTESEIDTKLSTNTNLITAHTSNRSNPHNVTKVQLGLGNVENKSSATILSELTKDNVTTALGYIPPTTNTTYSVATAGTEGLMSAADKAKLDSIASGANQTVIDSVLNNTSTNPVQNKIINAEIESLKKLVGDENVADQIAAIKHPVTSVNGKTGAITLNASDVGALPISTKIISNLSDGLSSGSLRMTGAVVDGEYGYLLGAHAFAEGYKTKAAGSYSHAEGNNTNAGAECAHVEGYNTSASGTYSHAEGYQTQASGNSSHTEGAYTATYYNSPEGKLVGEFAHAEGLYAVAYAEAAHAEGWSTAASAKYAHAEGAYADASGEASHAEGWASEASGAYSHAEGYVTHATVYADHAEGTETTASGGNSHAEGSYTTASGQSSHAEGNSTTASGPDAHAEGSYTTSSGYASHAEGDNTMASGYFGSHAEGSHTEAYGTSSHAEGVGTIAYGEIQHAQGKYNIKDIDGTYAHIVGNGEESQRSNAHTLDWSGNAWFKGDVYVGGVGQDDSNAKTLATQEYVASYVIEQLSETIGDEPLAEQLASATANANQYTDEEISKLINSNSTTLETLNKISDAMGENADVIEALNNSIGTKANASDLTSHTSNTFNPHSVTKAQIGLGNVENKSSATIRGELTKDNVTTALGYVPPKSDTQYDAATVSAAGLMSVNDKVKLDNIEVGANKTIIDASLNESSSNPVQNKVIYTAIQDLKLQVGDDPVSEQISLALNAKSDVGHTHDSIYYTEKEIDDKLNGKSNIGHNHNETYAAKSHGAHVPSPETANNAKFLRNDNTWQTVTPSNIGAAVADHGTHVLYSTDVPVMDGAATVGSAATVARSDHRHPTDTSRAAATDLADLKLLVGDDPVSEQISLEVEPMKQAISDLSVSGKVITYTKLDGTTGTIETQDTVTSYPRAGTSFGLVATGGDVTIAQGLITVKDNSHKHTVSNIDGLSTRLNSKVALSNSDKQTISNIDGNTALALNAASTNSYLEYLSNDTTLGSIGVNSSKQPVFNDGNDHIMLHVDNYENYADAKGSASAALVSANEYTNSQINAWVGDEKVIDQITSAIDALGTPYQYGSELPETGKIGDVFFLLKT